MVRYARITLELLAGVIALLAVIGMFVFWRLSTDANSATTFTPYFEAAINNILPDARTNIEHTELSWDKDEQTIALHGEGVSIHSDNDRLVAWIPKLDVRLSLIGILVGQLMPTNMKIDHPQIRLERRPDGHLYFGGLSTASDGHGDITDTLKVIATDLPRSHFLRHLEISRAVIDVRDMSDKSLWSISMPNINLVRNHGSLSGRIAVDVTNKSGIVTLESHYLYDRDSRVHRLSLRIDQLVPAALAGGHPDAIGLAAASYFNLPLTGEIETAFDSNLNLIYAATKIQSDKGSLDIPSLWNKPRTVDSISVEANYDDKNKKLSVPSLKVDFGGAKMEVELAGEPSANPKHDMDFTLNAHMTKWPMDEYKNLWPKTIIPNATKWMVANMSQGVFDDGRATFKGNLSWNDLSNIEMTEGHGKIAASNGTVSYINGMPSIKNVKADADFDLTKMSVLISSGSIDHLQFVPFTVVMSGFEDTTQTISIPMKLNGPIPEILQLINKPPLRYADAIGLPINAVDGRADAIVTLDFPMLDALEIKDMGVKASATLSNVSSIMILKGLNIQNGNLSLIVDKNGFNLQGPVDVNGFAVQANWDESFDASSGRPYRKLSAKGVIKDDQFKSLGFNALNGSRGQSTVNVLLVQEQPPSLKTTLTCDVDMTGAEIHFDQMNWRKPAKAPSALKLTADIPPDGPITISSLAFTGPAANIIGKAIVSREGELQWIELDPFVLGRTDSALYVSRIPDSEKGMRFESYGRALDISGLRGGNDPGHTDPEPKEYRLNIGKLFTSADGVIAKAEGTATRSERGWSTIKLSGLADGTEPLSISLQPTPTNREFRITSENFGKALKGLGLTNSVTNGKLEIYGESQPTQPDIIIGTVKIGSFEVHQLPALVRLLNATSPFGFMGIINDSTSFSKLKGKFRWQGDMVEVKNIEAPGSSIGMNVEGRVDLNSGQTKLNGTVVPFSSVNGIIGSIPLLGDILTGGDGGGILAVSYTISGTMSDPKVSVNPVSLLTPGFLRNLFFSGDDNFDDEPAPDAPIEPLTAPSVPITVNNISR
jgi:hypothetical protein